MRDKINEMSFSNSSTLAMKGGINFESFRFQSLCMLRADSGEYVGLPGFTFLSYENFKFNF